MYTIEARNVNHAYYEALWKMRIWGVKEQTRNGDVLAVPSPVATTYRNPTERMLFDPKRDANPYFHVMEAMWMLAGDNDVAFPAKFAQNIKNYSDNGYTLNGAYGYRWRRYFDKDQILWVIKHLHKTPNSRRAHIGMWDSNSDPQSIDDGTRDVPCNTGIDFRILNNYLNMTVYCRSNDIIWGCYGANAVHMSYLHEFVAMSLGALVGSYTQISNNWHIYPIHYHLLDSPSIDDVFDPYNDLNCSLVPLINPNDDYRRFLYDLSGFVHEVRSGNIRKYASPWGYIKKVLRPMALSWNAHKAGDAVDAKEFADMIQDYAISLACTHWLNRRQKRRSHS